MIRVSEIRLSLSEADAPHAALRTACATALAVPESEIATLTVFKRSFDARKAQLLAVFIVDVALLNPEREASVLTAKTGTPHIAPTPDMHWQPPAQAPQASAPRPVVVGLGPCGLFAGLVLAQMGFKPIVLERGPPVRQRTKDTWGLWRKGVLNPNSNVQFGEGGAGLFSDGKLYSQIKDPRYLGRKVMEEFVKAGAPPEILWEAHPHIGTFKLVPVVEHMREQIISLGGEIRFNQCVVDVLIEGTEDARSLRGLVVRDVTTNATHELHTDHAVLALGHSARETFAMLHHRGVWLEAKPFSIGFRIEHPQGVIDRARWGRHAGNAALGAAEYRLVHHATQGLGAGRSVYSFCMCPGGTVVAATSEMGRVVTNGMSQYSRNERNANAGIVVGITPEDFPTDPAAFAQTLGPDFADTALPDARQHHPLAGIVLQRQLESQAYLLGGQNYKAPAQLVGDFIAQRASTTLGDVLPSYQPGVTFGDLQTALPDYAIAAIREALPAFGKKIGGFDMPDAVLTGVETRTSSPLRLTRGEDLQSLNLRGLYPAGEGAGYAGGILSAAVDGIRVGEALALSLVQMQTARA